MANCTPCGCRLRNEYRRGQSPYPAAAPSGGTVIPVFGGMAQVPMAPVGYAQAFQAINSGTSSPIMYVLLVPSMIAASVMPPWRMSARQKMPSPFSSPLNDPLAPRFRYGVEKSLSVG